MKRKLRKSGIWTLKKADTMFSEYIRTRDKMCRRCGKARSKDNPLTNSHFWGRQHKATRFSPENCIALCWMPCHKYHFEKEKQGEYRDLMILWLGQEKYDKLALDAASTYPQSRAIMDCMRLLKAL